jgi:hypothetical protein
MPQPDSSRSTNDYRWNDAKGAWPIDPAAPQRFGARMAGRPERSKEDPEKDARTPQDPDGNEELERTQKEAPPSRRTATERDAQGTSHSRAELEGADTGRWVAQPFTLDDELDDTWPTVPTPYLDD